MDRPNEALPPQTNKKIVSSISATTKTSLCYTYIILLKCNMKMSYFDASAALNADALIRCFSVSFHMSGNILLNPNTAKATMHLGNQDNYLFSLFQDIGISISTHDISTLFVCF